MIPGSSSSHKEGDPGGRLSPQKLPGIVPGSPLSVSRPSSGRPGTTPRRYADLGILHPREEEISRQIRTESTATKRATLTPVQEKLVATRELRMVCVEEVQKALDHLQSTFLKDEVMPTIAHQVEAGISAAVPKAIDTAISDIKVEASQLKKELSKISEQNAMISDLSFRLAAVTKVVDTTVAEVRTEVLQLKQDLSKFSEQSVMSTTQVEADISAGVPRDTAVSEIRTEVAILKQELSKFSDHTKQVEVDFSAVVPKVDITFNTTVSEVMSEVSQLKQELSNWKAPVIGEVAQLKEELRKFSDQKNIDVAVSEVKAEVSQLKQDFSKFSEQNSCRLAQVEAGISTAVPKVDITFNTSVSDIVTEVSQLKQEFSNWSGPVIGEVAQLKEELRKFSDQKMLDAAVSEVRTEVSQLKQDFSKFSEQNAMVADLSSRLEQVEAGISTAVPNVSITFNTAVDEVRTEISLLKQDLGKFSDQHSMIADLSTLLFRLEAEVKKVSEMKADAEKASPPAPSDNSKTVERTAALDGLMATVEQTESLINKQIDELKAQNSTLQQECLDIRTTMNSQIDELKAQKSTMQQECLNITSTASLMSSVAVEAARLDLKQLAERFCELQKECLNISTTASMISSVAIEDARLEMKQLGERVEILEKPKKKKSSEQFKTNSSCGSS